MDSEEKTDENLKTEFDKTKCVGKKTLKSYTPEKTSNVLNQYLPQKNCAINLVPSCKNFSDVLDNKISENLLKNSEKIMCSPAKNLSALYEQEDKNIINITTRNDNLEPGKSSKTLNMIPSVLKNTFATQKNTETSSNTEVQITQMLKNASNKGIGSPNLPKSYPNLMKNSPNFTINSPNLAKNNPNLIINSPNIFNSLKNTSNKDTSPNLTEISPPPAIKTNVGVSSPTVGMASPTVGVASPTVGVSSPNLSENNPNTPFHMTVLGREQIKKRLQSFSLMKQGIHATPIKKILKQPKVMVQIVGGQGYNENGEKLNEKIILKKPPKKGPNPQEKAKAVIDEIEEIKRSEAAKLEVFYESRVRGYGTSPVKPAPVAVPPVKDSHNQEYSKINKPTSAPFEHREQNTSRSEKSGRDRECKKSKKDKRRSSEREEKKKREKSIEEEMPLDWKEIVDKDMDFKKISKIKERTLKLGGDKYDKKDKKDKRSEETIKKPMRKEDIAKPPIMFAYPSMPRQPFVAISSDDKDKTKYFPQESVKFTQKHPSISFCENPEYASDVCLSRKQILYDAPQERINLMMQFMENKTKPFDSLKIVNSARKWYPRKDYLVESEIVYEKSGISYGLSVLSESYIDEPEEIQDYTENTIVKVNSTPKPKPEVQKPKNDKAKIIVEKSKSRDRDVKSKSREKSEIKEIKLRETVKIEETLDVNLPNGMDETIIEKEADKTPNTDEYTSNWESDEDIITDILEDTRRNEDKPYLKRNYRNKNWESDENLNEFELKEKPIVDKYTRKESEETFIKHDKKEKREPESKKREVKQRTTNEYKNNSRYEEIEDKYEKKKHDDNDFKDKYDRKKREDEDKHERKAKRDESEERNKYDKKKTDSEDKYERRGKHDEHEEIKNKYDKNEEFRNRYEKKKPELEEKYERKGKYDNEEYRNKFEKKKQEPDEKYERKGKYDEHEEFKSKLDKKKQEFDDKYDRKGKYDEHEEFKNKFEKKKQEPDEKYERKGKYDEHNDEKYERKGKYDEHEEFRNKFEKKKQEPDEKYERKGKYDEHDDEKYERKGKYDEHNDEKYERKGKYDEHEEFRNKFEKKKQEPDEKYERKGKYDEHEEFRSKLDKKKQDLDEKYERKGKYDEHEDFRNKFERKEQERKGKYDEHDEFRNKYEKKKQEPDDKYERKSKYDEREEIKYKYERNVESQDRYARKGNKYDENEEFRDNYEHNRQESEDRYERKPKYIDNEDSRNKYERRKHEEMEEYNRKSKIDEVKKFDKKRDESEDRHERRTKYNNENEEIKKNDHKKRNESEDRQRKVKYDENEDTRNKYDRRKTYEDSDEYTRKTKVEETRKYDHKKHDDNEDKHDRSAKYDDFRDKYEYKERKDDETHEKYKSKKRDDNEEKSKREENEERYKKKMYEENEDKNKRERIKYENDKKKFDVELRRILKTSESKSVESEKYTNKKRNSYTKIEENERKLKYDEEYIIIDEIEDCDKKNSKKTNKIERRCKRDSYTKEEKQYVEDKSINKNNRSYKESEERFNDFDENTPELPILKNRDVSEEKILKNKSKEMTIGMEEKLDQILKSNEMNNSWSTDEETVTNKKSSKKNIDKETKIPKDKVLRSKKYRKLYKELEEIEDKLTKKLKKKTKESKIRESKKKKREEREKYKNKVKIDYTDYEKNLEEPVSWYQSENNSVDCETDVKPRNKIKINFSDFDHPLLENEDKNKKAETDENVELSESINEIIATEEVAETIEILDEKEITDKIPSVIDISTDKDDSDVAILEEMVVEETKIELVEQDIPEIVEKTDIVDLKITTDISPVSPPLPIPSPVLPTVEKKTKSILVSEYEEFMKAVCFDSTQDITVYDDSYSTLDSAEVIPEKDIIIQKSEVVVTLKKPEVQPTLKIEPEKIEEPVKKIEKTPDRDSEKSDEDVDKESEESSSENSSSDSSSYNSDSDSSASSKNSQPITILNIKQEKFSDSETEMNSENRKRKFDSNDNLDIIKNKIIKTEKIDVKESEDNVPKIENKVEKETKPTIINKKLTEIVERKPIIVALSPKPISEINLEDIAIPPCLPENIPLPNEPSSTSEIIKLCESSPKISIIPEAHTPSPIKKSRSIIPIKLLTAETRKQANETANTVISTDESSGFGIMPIKNVEIVTSSDSLTQTASQKIATLYEALPTIELIPSRKRQNNLNLNISPIKKIMLDKMDDDDSDEDFTEKFMKQAEGTTQKDKIVEKIIMEEEKSKIIDTQPVEKLDIDTTKVDKVKDDKNEDKKVLDKEKVDTRKNLDLRSDSETAKRTPRRNSRERRENDNDRRRDRSRDRSRRDSVRDKRRSTEKRRDIRQRDYSRERETRLRGVRRSKERDRRIQKTTRNTSRDQDDTAYRNRSRDSRKHSGSPSPKKDTKSYKSPTPTKPLDDTDFSTTSMDIVQSPVNSPLSGFKRSLADSTISDSELSKHNLREESTEKSPHYTIPAIHMLSRTTDSPASPKRISLDDRINLVLGIEKEPPKQIGTVCTRGQYDTGHQPSYQDGFAYGRNEFEGYGGQGDNYSYGNQYPYHYPQGRNENNVKVLQVGNVIQVVPTEQPPPPIIQPVMPKINLSEMPPKVVQVGNMLQIVPITHMEEPRVSISSPALPSASNICKPSHVTPPLPEMSVGPPPKTTEQLMVERRAEKEKRRVEREERRKEKEKKRKEKEKRRQIKIKLKTENMIKRALMLETGEIDPEMEDMTEPDIPADLGESRITSLPWPPAVCLGTLSLSKTPTKGILVSHGFSRQTSSLSEEDKEIRKIVKFADGICPGEGTSPSGGEDLPSPPPPPKKLPKEKRYQKKLKNKSKKKIKVKIIRTQPSLEEEEDSDDDLPPPPPPPGSPPPHLWPPRVKPINNVHPQIPTSIYPPSPFPQTVLYPPAFSPASVPLVMHPPGPPPGHPPGPLHGPPAQQSPRHHLPVLPLHNMPPGPPNIHQGPPNIHQGPPNIHQGPPNIHQGPPNIHQGPPNIHQGPPNIHQGPPNIHQGPPNIHQGPPNIHQGPPNLHQGPPNMHQGPPPHMHPGGPPMHMHHHGGLPPHHGPPPFHQQHRHLAD